MIKNMRQYIDKKEAYFAAVMSHFEQQDMEKAKKWLLKVAELGQCLCTK